MLYNLKVLDSGETELDVKRKRTMDFSNIRLLMFGLVSDRSKRHSLDSYLFGRKSAKV